MIQLICFGQEIRERSGIGTVLLERELEQNESASNGHVRVLRVCSCERNGTQSLRCVTCCMCVARSHATSTDDEII